MHLKSWSKKSLLFTLFSLLFLIDCYFFSEESITNLSIVEKINLNRASLFQIEKIFLSINMDKAWASKVFQYRREHGEIYSFEELAFIGFSPEELELLRKYFYIETERIGVDEILESIQGNELENIEYYYDFLVTPLNLNTANTEDLANLPGMDFEKARKIVQYREENEINTLFQLTNAGISKKNLLLISPFITIKPSLDKGFVLLSRISSESVYEKKISNAILIETNLPALYYSKVLLQGRTMEAYLSIPVISNSITTAEWEEIIPYLRYYFLWSNEGINRKGFLQILIGHYQISLGQNLLLGPAFPAFISDIRKFPIKKEGRRVIPYKSASYDVDQNGIRDYFNGFVAEMNLTEKAMGIGMPECQIFGFYSYFNNEPLIGITNQEDFGAGIEGRFLNNTTVLGTAFLKQQRYDGAYNNTGMSFYYDIFPVEKINLFGEYANFDGFSTKHGFVLRPEPFYASTIMYYAQTNYQAPNGSDILHGEKGVCGFLFGFGLDGEIFEGQFYADFYKKVTNETFYQRHEGKIKFLFLFKSEILRAYEIEIKSRYSLLKEGKSLRNYINQKFEMFRKIILLSVGWQNLFNYTLQEAGNMGTFRIIFKPLYALDFYLEWSTYNSKSYNSALYRLDIRNLNEAPEIKSYYGFGNEFGFSVNWKVDEWGKIGFRLREDKRELYSGVKQIDRNISGFMALEF